MATPPDARTPSPLLLHSTLLGVQLAFASLSVVGKLALVYLTPFALSFARITGACIVLLGVELAKHGRPRLPVAEHARIAGLALLGVVLNQLLFLSGLAHTTATHATLLGSTIPAFTVVIAIVLGRERLSLRAIVGLAIAFGSVAWLVTGEHGTAGGSWVGDAMILANALSYALYLVLARGTLERVGPARVIALVFFYGMLFTAPLGAADLVRALPHLGWRGTWLLAYLVVVATVFTYAANAFALRHAKSSLVAVYIYVQPVVATLLAAWWLHEQPGPRVYAAGALVLFGVGLVSFPRRAA